MKFWKKKNSHVTLLVLRIFRIRYAFRRWFPFLSCYAVVWIASKRALSGENGSRKITNWMSLPFFAFFFLLDFSFDFTFYSDGGKPSVELRMNSEYQNV